MVVTSYDLATEVGLKILKSGGNAVDAAVATGFALAVVFPTAGNIGGGGFMVIRLPDGSTSSIDFREKAPLGAHRDMYLDENGHVIEEKSLKGYLASGVPGTVAGLNMALEKFGSMALDEVMAPAIACAKHGFRVSAEMSRDLKRLRGEFADYPASVRSFMKPDGTCYEEGDIIRQPDLARALEMIAAEGPDAFYHGDIAEMIAADMERNGGLISQNDLAEYQAVERPCVHGTYRGHEILCMGLPSSGGIALIQMLNVLEGFPIRSHGYYSADYVHLLVETMRRVYADRAAYLGDSDYVDVPTAQLIDKRYTDHIREGIDIQRATPSTEISPGLDQYIEGDHTTHYSIVDENRMTVAVTTTLNTGFGSKVVIDGAGFLMNNEMNDFTLKPGHPNTFGLVMYDANAIEPGKRMLSSMSPTIVTRDGEVVLTLGAMGGPLIITSVLQTILNVIDFDMNADEAVASPRIHHQWLPDHIDYEPGALTEATRATLESMGHRLHERGKAAEVHAIKNNPGNNVLSGGADPRWEGSAAGY
jgi:gamma-glutamyltranspeptidase/glutathione hydrolase